MNNLIANLTSADFWLRLLYILLFACAWQVAEVLLVLLAIIQIGYRLFTGAPDSDCAGWGNSVSQYAWQIGRYVTSASEQKPWPFSEWPAAGARWHLELVTTAYTVDELAGGDKGEEAGKAKDGAE